MTELSIDLETFSSVDLKKCGLYRYVESPDFEIMLFGFAFDDDPVTVLDFMNFDEIPKDVMQALTMSGVHKKAFNAAFEMAGLGRHFGRDIDPSDWYCTMVRSLMMGLPASLGQVAKALRLGTQKDTAGTALINYFSKPCKPTGVNGGRTRNLPEHDWEKWEKYKHYNQVDVEAEREIGKRLAKFPIPEFEHKLWELDQKINRYGVQIDRELVRNAIKADDAVRERLIDEAQKITGLDNPNSVTQLKNWLNAESALDVDKLTKETLPGLLDSAKEYEDGEALRLLEIRQELSKSSVKKYSAMDRSICSDGRVRGLLQYYGANRTGRWAGRIVQVQNLPKNKIKDIELAREIVKEGRYEDIEWLYGSTTDILSQLVRTAFVPKPGHRFTVADFSAIEARVTAWLAGETWRLNVFNGHGKIYEASAAQMFHLDLDEITKDLRQRGKVAELALGFGGGPKALIRMGALDQGLTEDELPEIVQRWRAASPSIVQFWKTLEVAAKTAIKERAMMVVQHGISFNYESGMLFVQLPSGRRLAYVRPTLERDPNFGEQITYEGYDNGSWGRVKTYGGKLCENLVQATARDCLAVAMQRVSDAGHNIVFHVHDEVVVETPDTEDLLEPLIDLMRQPISWAPGLPLNAAGFVSDFYMKD